MLNLRTEGNMLPNGIMYNRTFTIIKNVQNWTCLVILQSRILIIKNSGRSYYKNVTKRHRATGLGVGTQINQIN